MSAINKRKYINKIKEKLPYFLQDKVDRIVDFLKFVVVERWYKIYFLGFFNFVRYKVNNKFKANKLVQEKRNATSFPDNREPLSLAHG